MRKSVKGASEFTTPTANKKKATILWVFCLLATVINAQHNSLNSSESNNLLKLFIQSKYAVKKLASNVDTVYINYKQAIYESFCLANPKEEFNRTDLRLSKYCDARLVLCGAAIEGSLLRVILFEEDIGGALGRTCDIYQTYNGKITKLVSLQVPSKINSIAKLKMAIKSDRYTIIDSFAGE